LLSFVVQFVMWCKSSKSGICRKLITQVLGLEEIKPVYSK